MISDIIFHRTKLLISERLNGVFWDFPYGDSGWRNGVFMYGSLFPSPSYSLMFMPSKFFYFTLISSNYSANCLTFSSSSLIYALNILIVCSLYSCSVSRICIWRASCDSLSLICIIMASWASKSFSASVPFLFAACNLFINYWSIFSFLFFLTSLNFCVRADWMSNPLTLLNHLICFSKSVSMKWFLEWNGTFGPAFTRISSTFFLRSLLHYTESQCSILSIILECNFFLAW